MGASLMANGSHSKYQESICKFGWFSYVFLCMIGFPESTWTLFGDPQISLDPRVLVFSSISCFSVSSCLVSAISWLWLSSTTSTTATSRPSPGHHALVVSVMLFFKSASDWVNSAKLSSKLASPGTSGGHPAGKPWFFPSFPHETWRCPSISLKQTRVLKTSGWCSSNVRPWKFDLPKVKSSLTVGWTGTWASPSVLWAASSSDLVSSKTWRCSS